MGYIYSNKINRNECLAKNSIVPNYMLGNTSQTMDQIVNKKSNKKCEAKNAEPQSPNMHVAKAWKGFKEETKSAKIASKLISCLKI